MGISQLETQKTENYSTKGCFTSKGCFQGCKSLCAGQSRLLRWDAALVGQGEDVSKKRRVTLSVGRVSPS